MDPRQFSDVSTTDLKVFLFLSKIGYADQEKTFANMDYDLFMRLPKNLLESLRLPSGFITAYQASVEKYHRDSRATVRSTHEDACDQNLSCCATRLHVTPKVSRGRERVREPRVESAVRQQTGVRGCGPDRMRDMNCTKTRRSASPEVYYTKLHDTYE